MDAAADKLMRELREVVAAAEALLAAPGASAEHMREIRERAEQALGDARERLVAVSGEVEDRVRRNPWAALGIAAGVGLIIGLLLSRK